MAMRRNVLGNTGPTTYFRRWASAFAQPAPLDTAIGYPLAARLPPLVLPESENSSVRFQFPNFCFGGGSMELMAVPKKKISKYKRGLRNGPKALKPVPVIIRCRFKRL